MPPLWKLAKNCPAGQFLVVTVAPMSTQFLIICSSSAARWLLPEVVLMTHASFFPFLLRVPSAALTQPSASSSALALVTSRWNGGMEVSVYGARALINGPFRGLPTPPT